LQLKQLKDDLRTKTQAMKASMTELIAQTKTDMREKVYNLYYRLKHEHERKERDTAMALSRVKIENEELKHQQAILVESAKKIHEKAEELEFQLDQKKREMKRLEDTFSQSKARSEKLYDEIIKNLSAEKTRAIYQARREIEQKDQEYRQAIDRLVTENSLLKQTASGYSDRLVTQSAGKPPAIYANS